MIKAVLFDLDGTLIDTNRLILESFKHTLSKHLDIIPGDDELVKYFGEPLVITLGRYDRENVETLRKTYIKYNEEVHDDLAEEVAGAGDTLLRLRDMGLMTGVVTSKRRIMAERGLKLFDLYDLMDVLITPEDTLKHKPDPEPLLKACERLGLEPKEVLYVGDSHFDILCGKNSGALTCLVEYTAIPIDEIMKYNPDYVVGKLTEIPEILNSLNRGEVV